MDILKRGWFWAAIIGILAIGAIAWWAFRDGSSPTSTNTGTEVSEPLPEAPEDADIPDPGEPVEEPSDDVSLSAVEFDYVADLEDVTGGNATGVASATFDGGAYILEATFENLPDPEGTDFYEGWVVRSSPLSVISTGALTKNSDTYQNDFTSFDDLTDHEEYVLTIEPDDGDPAPADHVLEGVFSQQ